VERNRFKPTIIGAALMFLYCAKDIPIYSPALRAYMEGIINEVGQGLLTRENAINIIREHMRTIFNNSFEKKNELIEYIKGFIDEMRNLRYD